MRRYPAGNDVKAIQRISLENPLGRHEVTLVNRIEGSAEKSCSHGFFQCLAFPDGP